MKTPTDVLREEHRIILEALDLLESTADRITGGGSLPDGWWAEVIAWLRAFADRNHHAKEERSLFPAMVKAGVPAEGGPIAVMLEEHTQGRALVQAMAAAGPAHQPAIARQYVRLLRDHIEKENGVLFPLADAVLDDEARQRLEREFQTAEIEQGRDGDPALARAAIERLRTAVGSCAGHALLAAKQQEDES